MNDNMEPKNVDENLEGKTEKNKKKDGKKKKIIGIVCGILIVAVIGIFLLLTKNGMNQKTKIKKEVEKVESKYEMSGNALEDFDLSFLQLENKDENTIYSPLSIKYALEMLSEGAKGNTKAQLDAVIGKYEARKYNNSANMSFANAMFINNSNKDQIKNKYMDTLKNKYNADIVFDSFTTPDTINSWVKDKTFGLIDKLFDDVSRNSYVLANALAINMEWVNLLQSTPTAGKRQYTVSYHHEDFSDYISLIEGDVYPSVKFNNSMDAKSTEVAAAINKYNIVKELGEENIRKEITNEYNEWVNGEGSNYSDNLPTEEFVDKFIKELNENYKQVDTSTDFLFYNDDEVKTFAKDLKEYDGTTLQYVGIMPKNVDINTFVTNSNADKLNKIINNLKEIKEENFAEGKVYKIKGNIPLFNFDYELDFQNDLKQLGITDVFDLGKADLSNITGEKDTCIEKASHKANIEFSNEGIKAAAVTGFAGLGSASGGFEHLYKVPVEEIDISFNQPYIFLIRDKKTGEVWFVGKVVKPTENNK